ncbi:peptidase [Bifidobacterium goeldii]|uniref:Peptidase n=1 Tax=Bifidobacterium goeldii TaxID=2306975 RepID=A0A430FKV2_9BIFI|nr:L,D-transpeptidase family protein [Bifidobacterium goeldii]RSX53519.1 peptidase [Bifidobacterium goeldii]
MNSYDWFARISHSVRGTMAAIIAVLFALAAMLAIVPANEARADDSGARIDMYRLYNMSSGEHFYTGDGNEKNSLVNAGWIYEGIGWVAPQHSNTPVWRLYNPNGGDHHYTIDTNERDALVGQGWRNEGIGWYSSDTNRSFPLYRQYNPKARTGSHNYTLNGNEVSMLTSQGWRDEGVAWYGIGGGKAAPQPQWMRPSEGAYPSLANVPGLNIEVSLGAQRVYVKSGSNTIYTMIASTGTNNTTPRGIFHVQNRGMNFYNPSEGMGANYWVSWKDWGVYLFHSVPTDANGNYIVSEANKLGHPASHGCVRLSIPDAKWLYEQLPSGVQVHIY